MHTAPAPTMSFTEAITTVLGKYVDAQGRASRREYWFFVLFLLLANIATLGLDLALWRSIEFTPFNAVFAFLMLLPSVTSAIRRLHDTGRSGWWMLMVFVPLVGPIMLLYWLCIAGTPAPNAYGPPAR